MPSEDERPTHGAWQDTDAKKAVPDCRWCKSRTLIRARQHQDDAPEVTLWSKEHGYLEVVLRYCLKCDPHVREVLEEGGRGG